MTITDSQEFLKNQIVITKELNKDPSVALIKIFRIWQSQWDNYDKNPSPYYKPISAGELSELIKELFNIDYKSPG